MALDNNNITNVVEGFGIPTDASFNTTPADGAQYLDLITNTLFFRSGGSWRATSAVVDPGALVPVGSSANSVTASLPVRSNGEYLGFGNLADTAASLVTQVMTVVPVPWRAGDTITKVSTLIGATAAGTPTNSWAAIYAGTNVAAPALLGQTADGLTAAIAASARFDFTFTTGANAPITVTKAQCPNGYVFAAIMVKATTVPSQVTVPNGAAAAQYAWFSTTPGASFAAVPGTFAFSAGSALTGTAPTTLVSVAAKTVAPLVFLS